MTTLASSRSNLNFFTAANLLLGKTPAHACYVQIFGNIPIDISPRRSARIRPGPYNGRPMGEALSLHALRGIGISSPCPSDPFCLLASLARARNKVLRQRTESM